MRGSTINSGEQVMSRELKPHGYFKEKGVIEKVFNKYVAEIAVLKTGDILQVGGHCILA